MHHEPRHCIAAAQILIHCHNNQTNQCCHHCHNHTDNPAVQQAVTGGFGILAGIAALPVCLGYQNADETGQKLVDTAHQIHIGKAPQFALSYLRQTASQYGQAEIHLAEGKQVEHGSENKADNSLKQVGPHYAVDTAHDRIDNKNNRKQKNDWNWVGIGKDLEQFSERLSLTAYPCDHDAGAQDSAESPGKFVADDKIINHLRHRIISKMSC